MLFDHHHHYQTHKDAFEHHKKGISVVQNAAQPHYAYCTSHRRKELRYADRESFKKLYVFICEPCEALQLSQNLLSQSVSGKPFVESQITKGFGAAPVKVSTSL